MLRYFVILILFPISIFSLNIDSLKNLLSNNLDPEVRLAALRNISRYYNMTNIDSTTKYNYIYKNYAKEQNNIEHLAKAYSSDAYNHIVQGNYKKSKKQNDSARSLFLRIKDSVRVAFTYNLEGRIMEKLSLMDSAFHSFSTALKLLKFDNFDYYLKNYNPDKEESVIRLSAIAIVLTDFGLFNIRMEKYDIAKKLFNKTLKLAETTNDNKRLAGTYSNLGMIFERRDSHNVALDYYHKALKYADKSNSLTYKMSILNNLGVIYANENSDVYDMKKSAQYYKQASKIAQEVSDEISELLFILNYARSISKIGEYERALHIVDSINVRVETINDIDLWKRYYGTLQTIYFVNNKMDSAYKYLQKTQVFIDSNRSEKSLEQINKLQVAFDSERKDYKINLLTKEKELLNIRMYFIVGLIIFILILTALLYSRYRIKIKAYNQIDDMNKKLIKSENNLKELNATKDKFFSIIAHDLKGPIGTYKNVLEYIENDYEKLSKSDIEEFILDMRESSDRLFALLEDLLTWANTQTGKLIYNPEKYNLKDVIENNVGILALTADNKNIKLKSELKHDIYTDFDVIMITTVIRNLVSNAIKFTDENGVVVLDAKEYEDEVIVSVKDNGTGIPEDIKTKLFNIAHHITSKGTKDERGTGLGLILCKEFISKHNGKIWVESEEGTGSEFKFSIPKSK